MLNSQSAFLKHSKQVYFGISVLIVITFNILLNHALHQHLHNVGELLVKQIYMLQLDPVLHKEVTNALLKNSHFMLEPTDSPKYFQHIIKLEREVFSFKTLSLSLYHWPAWVIKSYVFILLNIVLLGAIAWGIRWWSTLFVIKEPLKVSVFNKGGPVVKKAAEHFLKLPKTSVLSNPSLQNIFIIANISGEFHSFKNTVGILQSALKSSLLSFPKVSVKSLKNDEFAITILDVKTTNIDEFIQQVYQGVYVCCQRYERAIKQKIKFGVCNYYADAEQVSVYLLARSALNKVLKEQGKDIWRYEMNREQLGTLSNIKVVNRIKENKFIILFQPLFDLTEGEIIQHEALIRIKSTADGLIAAHSFIEQVKNVDDALLVDKAVITQVKKTLSTEPSSIKISVNLHTNNWVSYSFWQWLLAQLNHEQFNKKIEFGIKESHFMTHKKAILDIVKLLHLQHMCIVIDDIQSIENIFELSQCINVKAIKLSYQLVHLININEQLQRQVREIVLLSSSLQIPVYAVGIETKSELNTLTKLGVSAAQGFYFSEPLGEFNQVVFH
ncbi:EAL domain-containing protein [Pseudoalteromonas sp. MMG010]|uniref:EAL domain-containing protein n=1 Tax=Pseudoalteromonas sp. MMG010 TaxID=2822685 RepID=UPI001B3A392C|nr:EAL domain-containing protein [Pseudoalteromonas sp. MMG010]MBQ4832644.1 EAL domain-containing protein [Pseudoalteromonas sp. MMG010]